MNRLSLLLWGTALLSGACSWGTVTDSDSELPIEGARVVFERVVDGAVVQQWSAATAVDGQYRFDPYGGPGTTMRNPSAIIAPDLYRVRVSAPGYRPTTHYVRTADFQHEYAGQRYRDAIDFRLVPEGAPDADGDGLSAAWEARIGTRDDDVDTDGDGLSDFDELHGVDFVDLRTWIDGRPADPVVHDVYLRLFGRPDALDDSFASNATLNAMNAFIAEFSAALGAAPPIERKGRRYRRALHAAASTDPRIPPVVDFQLDDRLATANCTVDPRCLSCAAGLCRFGLDPQFEAADFDALKLLLFRASAPGGDAAWRMTRVGIVSKQYVDWAATALSMRSGIAELPGNDFIVTVSRPTFRDGATPTVLRSTIWHELGHTFGLMHHSNDNDGPRSTVHKSVMNYRYQLAPGDLPLGLATWSLGGGGGSRRSYCDVGFDLFTPSYSSAERCFDRRLDSADFRYADPFGTVRAACLPTGLYAFSTKSMFRTDRECMVDLHCQIDRPGGGASVAGRCIESHCTVSVPELGAIRAWSGSDQGAVDAINGSLGTEAVSLSHFRTADCDVDEWEQAGRLTRVIDTDCAPGPVLVRPRMVPPTAAVRDWALFAGKQSWLDETLAARLALSARERGRVVSRDGRVLVE